MDDAKEEVLGVLRQCSICEDKTIHVDGVCQSHQIVEPAAKREMPSEARPVGAPKRGRIRIWISVIVVLILVVLLGGIHIVHGAGSGIHFCWKDGWTFEDTFVNLDDVNANYPTSWKVLSALDKCLK